MTHGPMYGKTVDEIPPEWLAVKQKIKTLFGNQPWFMGVGIGEWGVTVLLLDIGDTQYLPTEVDGIPITVKVTGPILPLSNCVTARPPVIETTRQLLSVERPDRKFSSDWGKPI